jgi:hypothetical protein
VGASPRQEWALVVENGWKVHATEDGRPVLFWMYRVVMARRVGQGSTAPERLPAQPGEVSLLGLGDPHAVTKFIVTTELNARPE